MYRVLPSPLIVKIAKETSFVSVSRATPSVVHICCTSCWFANRMSVLEIMDSSAFRCTRRHPAPGQRRQPRSFPPPGKSENSGSAVAMCTRGSVGASAVANAFEAPHSKKVIWSPASSVNINAVGVWVPGTSKNRLWRPQVIHPALVIAAGKVVADTGVECYCFAEHGNPCRDIGRPPTEKYLRPGYGSSGFFQGDGARGRYD